MKSLCNASTDDSLKEDIVHGEKKFPIAYYKDIFSEFKNGLIDWHWHREVEFVSVSEGFIFCLIGQERIKINQGEGIFINSGIIHRYENGKDGMMENIVFSPELVAQEGSLIYEKNIYPLISFGPDYLLLSSEAFWKKSVLEDLSNIYSVQAFLEKSSSPINTLLLLTNILKTLIENIPTEILEESKAHNGKCLQSTRLHLMLQFIHDNYHRNIGLGDIAAVSSMSKSNALKTFKQGIGQSPVSYLIEHRLMQASLELKTTSKPITRISELSGFSNSSYFCRKFREYFGTSPSAYRKKSTHNIPSF